MVLPDFSPFHHWWFCWTSAPFIIDGFTWLQAPYIIGGFAWLQALYTTAECPDFIHPFFPAGTYQYCSQLTCACGRVACHVIFSSMYKCNIICVITGAYMAVFWPQSHRQVYGCSHKYSSSVRANIPMTLWQQKSALRGMLAMSYHTF